MPTHIMGVTAVVTTSTVVLTSRFDTRERMAAFLVMLREGLEAALIVAILLAYVKRREGSRESRWIWVGTALAAVLSLAAGIVIFATIGSLDDRAEEIAEGVVAMVAAGLLTWMIFWMGSQARHMRTMLESKADLAFATGGLVALAMVAFVAVLREGLESALFLISTTVGTDADWIQLLGGSLGLAAAIGIGYGIYRGGTRIDLRLLFRITGALIVLFAAGLVAKGIHGFQEAGILPVVVDPVWDLGVLQPDTNIVGRFASSLFAWRPDPSLLMVIGYLAYLIPVGSAFLSMTRPVAGPSRTQRAGMSTAGSDPDAR